MSRLRRGRSPRASAARCPRRPSSSSPPGTTTSGGWPRARRCWSSRRRRPRSSTGAPAWRTSAAEAEALLQKADEASPERVFPFRPESAEVLQWATSRSSSWRPALLPRPRALGRRQSRRGAPAPRRVRREARLRALLRHAVAGLRERRARAVDGGSRAGRPPRPGPVAFRQDAGRATAARGRGRGRPGDGPALLRAVPGQLHPRHAPREGAARERAVPARAPTAWPGSRSFPTRARSRDAGSTARRSSCWRSRPSGRATPGGALRSIDAARLWPENLGAGKPYPENVDERLEDWLAAQCLARRGRSAESSALLQRVDGLRRARARSRNAGPRARPEADGPRGGRAEAPRRLVHARARERTRLVGEPGLRWRPRSPAGGRRRGRPGPRRLARPGAEVASTAEAPHEAVARPADGTAGHCRPRRRSRRGPRRPGHDRPSRGRPRREGLRPGRALRDAGRHRRVRARPRAAAERADRGPRARAAQRPRRGRLHGRSLHPQARGPASRQRARLLRSAEPRGQGDPAAAAVRRRVPRPARGGASSATAG